MCTYSYCDGSCNAPSTYDARPAECEFCGLLCADDSAQSCPGCSQLCPCMEHRAPLTNVPADPAMLPECDGCAAEIRAARPRTALDAMALGIAAAFLAPVEEARRLLDGGGGHSDADLQRRGAAA